MSELRASASTTVLPLVFGVLALCAGAATPSIVSATTAADSVAVVSTGASSYVGMALSVVPSDSSVGAIFSSLMPYERNRWRLFHWTPEAGTVELGDAAATLRRGQGYWLITKDPQDVQIHGTTPSAPDTFRIPLTRGIGQHAGWNQVGNPYAAPIVVGALRVVKRDSIRALGTDFTEPGAWVWVPADNAYSAATSIPSGQAFWVRLKDQDPSSAWTTWITPPYTRSACHSYGEMWDVEMSREGDPALLVGGNNLSLRRHLRGAWISQELRAPGTHNIYYPLSVRADELGNTHAVYVADNDCATVLDLRYVKSGPSGASDVRLGDADWTRQARVAVSADGVGHVFELRADVYTLLRHFDSRDPAHSDTVYNSTAFEDTAITGFQVAVTHTGTPVVLYSSRNDYRPRVTDLHFAELRGGRWVDSVLVYGEVDPPITSYLGPHSLALTPEGEPCVLYSYQGLHVLKRSSSGTWTTTLVPTSPPYQELQLAVDAQGRERFLAINGSSVSYVANTGSGWAAESVPVYTPRAIRRLMLDQDGNPGFAYRDSANTKLMFATKRPGDVVLQVPMGGGIVANAPDPVGASTGWGVKVSVVANGRARSSITLGALTPQVNEAIRIQLPPQPQELAPSIGILDDVDGAALACNLRPDAPRLEWRIVLGAREGPAEATLQLEGERLPPDARVWLSDPAADWRTEWKPGTLLTVVTTQGDRFFTLTVDRGTVPGTDAPGPRATSMRSVFPNPFQRSVGVLFVDLPRNGVRLDIFDVSGRLVRSLEHPGSAGEAVVVWDGRDAAGNSVPDGVYFASCRPPLSVRPLRLLKLR
jgi:hypothetical protein